MIMMDVELPQGATLERTNRVLDDIQDRIKDVPGVKGVMLISGSGSMSGSGEHCGMGVLLLDHWDDRKTPETQVGAIIAEIRKRTADVYAAKVTCFTTPAINGLGRLGGVGFNLCSDIGSDATALAAAAQAFARRIQELPEAGRVTCGFRADTPQLRLTLDRQKAEALGVDPSAVFSTLQNKLASVYVNDFNKDGRAYPRDAGGHRRPARAGRERRDGAAFGDRHGRLRDRRARGHALQQDAVREHQRAGRARRGAA